LTTDVVIKFVQEIEYQLHSYHRIYRL